MPKPIEQTLECVLEHVLDLIYGRVFFVSFVVGTALVLAATIPELAPTSAGLLLGLLLFDREYSLSPGKRTQCLILLLGLPLLCVGLTEYHHPDAFCCVSSRFVSLKLFPSTVGMCIGTVFALTAVPTLILFEIYRQVFWRHRRRLILANIRLIGFRIRMLQIDWRIKHSRGELQLADPELENSAVLVRENITRLESVADSARLSINQRRHAPIVIQ